MAETKKKKFYLAQKLHFAADLLKAGTLGVVFSITAHCWRGANKRVAVILSKDLNPEDEHKDMCKKLTAVFKNQLLKWNFSLQTQRIRDADGSYASPQTECRITLDMDIDIAEGIRSVLGKKDVSLQAIFYALKGDRREAGHSPQSEPIITQEMSIPAAHQGPILCMDTNYNKDIYNSLTHDMFTSTSLQPIIGGYLDLVLVVKAPNLETRVLGGPSDREKLIIYKQILEQEILPDSVIVAGDGNEIKCHRSFLAVHCPELYAMFATDMQEAKTGRVQMPEMSAEGVRALLAYLYHWDLSKPVESSAVALQLLNVGHMYNISLLEKDMRKLFLSEPNNWYSVDVAIDLYFFVEKLDETWNSLKEKAVSVLRRNVTQLTNSLSYQELFKTDPQAAMRLFEYTLKLSDQTCKCTYCEYFADTKK